MESGEDFCDDAVPQGERWAPLGAAAPENEQYDDEEYWTGYQLALVHYFKKINSM